MKRLPLFFAILALITLALPASAQLRYGIRLGGVIANASLNDAGGYSLANKGGFSGGFMLEYQVPTCGLAADIALLYTRYNTRLKIVGAPAEAFGRNIMEIPIHLKYKVNAGLFHNCVCPMVYTGPSLMMRMGRKHARPMSSDAVQPGWDVGVGVDIVNFVQLQAGYRFGLGNAVKSFDGHPDASMRTSGWQIAANLLFDF